MSKLRVTSLLLLVGGVVSFQAMVILPGFLDLKSARVLYRAAHDSPAREAEELRQRARAYQKSAARFVRIVGALTTVGFAGLLARRIYLSGSISGAFWHRPADFCGPPRLAGE